jgi:hypothetical protein
MSKFGKDPLVKQLNERDQRIIAYRPALRNLVGDLAASLLLHQVIYYHIAQERMPFFKFIQPCAHKLYRAGDSWVEVMGFSEDEYKGAIKKMGTRIRERDLDKSLADAQESTFGPDPDKRKKNQRILLNRHQLVFYWRNSGNVNYYTLNEPLLQSALELDYDIGPGVSLQELQQSLDDFSF